MRREDVRVGMRVVTTLAGVWTTAVVTAADSNSVVVRFTDPLDSRWQGAEADRRFDQLDFGDAVDALAGLA